MKGFKLDENGDIVITKEKSGKKIQMVEGNELIAQKIRTVLGTNKGEWYLNSEVGVDFDYLIGKHVTEDMIRSQIEDGVHQVNEAFYLSQFSVVFDTKQRTATVTFTVADNGEKVVTLTQVYGGETNANAASKLAEANALLADDRSSAARLERRLDGEM